MFVYLHCQTKTNKDMTQQEFESRTKVNVTANEFETINNFYMTCEADKDEFCKMWCKMNAGRVTAARLAAKEAAKKEAAREIAWQIYWNLTNCDACLAVERLTDKEIKFLAENGISEQDYNYCGIPYFKNNWEIACELNMKFSLRA